MPVQLKEWAVRNVKPRVGDEVWRALRDPLSYRRGDREPVYETASGPKPLSAMTLNELAVHFKTDKWGSHRYTQHYDRHLRHLRRRTFTLLEVGVGGYRRHLDGGRSLRMWKAYFPNAQIVGLDIEDKSFVDEDRIRTFRGSQADPAVLQGILDTVGDVQVVIDDGSHRPEHIRATFAYLFPRIAANGIYVIEDAQTSYWPAWGGSEDLSDPTTSVAMVKDLVDGLHYEEFIDPDYRPTYTDTHVRGVHAYHNVLIIEKGDNREGTKFGKSKRRLDEDDPAYRTPVPVVDQRRPFSPLNDAEA